MKPTAREGWHYKSFHLSFTSEISAQLQGLAHSQKQHGFSASCLYIMMSKIILSLASFQILPNIIIELHI